MQQSKAAFLSVLLAGVAGAVGGLTGPRTAIASHASDQASVQPAAGELAFVERPGILEFSGQLIVKLRRGLSPEVEAAARDRLASMVRTHHADVDEYVLDIPAASERSGRPVADRGENALAAELMATGWYEYAQPNWICYPVGDAPNDPWFLQQWHHVAMGSIAGWAISTGGAGQIMAFTDTGIDLTHPDLASKRVPGYDAYSNRAEVDGASVADANGHGTHVAGCGAAIGNNILGVAGVNWNARIMMVKVTIGNTNGAYVDDVLEGARWAVDHGAKCISTSFTGVDSYSAQTTGQYIRQRGGLYFYASGNDSRNLSGFDWPDVIVVGASSRVDGRVGLSAYGRAVDVFAPGEAIVSTVMGGGYQAWTGTSMAAPVASGVASILWSINPELTADQVQQMLFDTCADIGAAGEDDVFGHGRVDMLRSTLAALLSRGEPCGPDFNADGFLDFFDYDDFVACFADGACGNRSADFNGDGFLDFFDYDDFVLAFEAGC